LSKNTTKMLASTVQFSKYGRQHPQHQETTQRHAASARSNQTPKGLETSGPNSVPQHPPPPEDQPSTPTKRRAVLTRPQPGTDIRSMFHKPEQPAPGTLALANQPMNTNQPTQPQRTRPASSAKCSLERR